jgi:uncharacterized membrane protein
VQWQFIVISIFEKSIKGSSRDVFIFYQANYLKIPKKFISFPNIIITAVIFRFHPALTGTDIVLGYAKVCWVLTLYMLYLMFLQLE